MAHGHRQGGQVVLPDSREGVTALCRRVSRLRPSDRATSLVESGLHPVDVHRRHSGLLQGCRRADGCNLSCKVSPTSERPVNTQAQPRAD